MIRVIWVMPGTFLLAEGRYGMGADVRNYLTQDIIRRILQNYFGYDVNFVMNITDIDDKVCQDSVYKADDRSLSEQENRTSSNKPSNRMSTSRPNLWKRQNQHSRNT
jgi:cysteinyl-tRNA synthetase